MSTIAPIRQRTFDRLCGIVYESSGIVLGARKEALVTARVGKRMRTLGISDFDDYLRLVRDDQSEIVGLVDAVSTNVTGFYREPHHFTFLSAELERWHREGQTRFRFWSAACSTGEEPYTLGITVRETLPLDADVRILATDISTRALETARAATYPVDRMQPVSAETRQRWFVQSAGESGPQWQVKPAVSELVTFKRLNLSAPPFPMKGPLDAVFCRNVMIYFDDRVRMALLAEAYRLLKPGGLLVVGHAESLAGITSDFRYVSPSVYRKV